MKKIFIILISLLAIGSLGFASTNHSKVMNKKQPMTLVGKFNQLETEYNNIMMLEENEYAKIKLKAENANKQLQEKQAMRNTIEEKISKIEENENSRVFKSDYGNLVKEYKNVIKQLDIEIKQLSKTVENFQMLEQLKEGAE